MSRGKQGWVAILALAGACASPVGADVGVEHEDEPEPAAPALVHATGGYFEHARSPLADDFQFTGPVASFDSAEGYRAMAREAGQAVTSFEVRRQFVDGDTVCSIIDWEMAIPGVGPMTSAELLDVKDGQIVRGELIYDAEALRRAMAAANPGAQTE